VLLCPLGLPPKESGQPLGGFPLAPRSFITASLADGTAIRSATITLRSPTLWLPLFGHVYSRFWNLELRPRVAAVSSPVFQERLWDWLWVVWQSLAAFKAGQFL